MNRVVHTIARAMKKVFKKPSSWIIGVITVFVFLFMLIWITNLSLLTYLLSADTFSLGEKLYVFFTSIGNLGTNYTGFQLVLYMLLVSVSGLYIPMFMYHLRNQVAEARAGAAGILAIIMSVFGIGCSACGSIVISSLIGVSATASFIGLLPFGGYEIGLLAFALLTISLYRVSQKIVFPGVCHEGITQQIKRFTLG